ncbi:MAG: hypothetical protein AAGI63_14840 [Planctomycetota bacterium]
MTRSLNPMRLSAVVFCGMTILISNVAGAADDDNPMDNWGQVVDPDGDCTIKASGSELTIQIPDTRHDLNRRSGSLNAPRVMQSISGDFRLEVSVSGEFKPGPRSTAQKSTAFNGAGILLWHDERSHMRLERNSFGGGYCYPPLIEIRNKGRFLGGNPPVAPDTYFTGDSTSFRIERHGDVFTAYIRHGDQQWQLLKSRSVGFPDKLMVGVSAINTSNAPMTVKFQNLKLTSIEAE